MNTLFLVSFIIEAFFAVGFTVAPAAVLGPFGITPDETAVTSSRLFGSALVGLAILLWFVRKSENPEFRQAAVYSLFGYYLVSAVVLFIAEITGQMNVLGWGTVVLHIVLGAWFAYYLLRYSGRGQALLKPT